MERWPLASEAATNIGRLARCVDALEDPPTSAAEAAKRASFRF
jgi:hypothetical protein